MSLIINKMVKDFAKIGFSAVDGPELDEEWYNFDALNVPKDHPSRDMQDTFWIDTPDGSRKVLRTHTSNMQIHSMEEWVKKNREKMDKGEEVDPLAVVIPGKVYRNEATDATHEANFYQIECLLVDKKEKVSIGKLKWVIENMLSGLFGRKVTVRFRSSFFPFTEPSLETDMSCFRCDGSGCSTCKHSGFIEIGGSGMVNPKVLENCGIDSTKYAGFAYGFGIDRVAMMLYGIEDVRNLYNADMRFTSQF
jgi:phenylalanyl-tRNA synthetase alpha chain